MEKFSFQLASFCGGIIDHDSGQVMGDRFVSFRVNLTTSRVYFTYFHLRFILFLAPASVSLLEKKKSSVGS